MIRLRIPLILLTIILSLVWWAAARVGTGLMTVPIPLINTVIVDTHELPQLEPYRRYEVAVAAGDLATIHELSLAEDSYLAYRAAFYLARHEGLDYPTRFKHYLRVFELRIDDPLDRGNRRKLMLEMATVAEQAGYTAEALGAYEAALPLIPAANGIARLQTDPYRQANIFLQARFYKDAIRALGGRSAPSIEAPAYQKMGEPAKALDAYNRWLAEQPDNQEALKGKAWSHFYLGEYQTANELFETLDDSSARYGQALIANKWGETDRAVTMLSASGNPDHLWQASTMLESAGRFSDAVPVYLQLAKSSSSLADDAAYRAYTLAERLGETDNRDTAKTLLDERSFFSRKLGTSLSVPTSSSIINTNPPALALASALVNQGDTEAAIGELVIALRLSENINDTVMIAEALQQLGEFRQSQRAATLLIREGSEDARVWRIAYPLAYPHYVMKETTRLGVDPTLVWAIMRQESAFYPYAVSVSDAQGLMQVIPSTWQWLSELQGEAPGDPFNIADNIRYGVYYLRWLMDYFDEYGSDLELIIPSYNRGQGYILRLFEGDAVATQKDDFYRKIDALETREYLQKVMTNYEVYNVLYKNP